MTHLNKPRFSLRNKFTTAVVAAVCLFTGTVAQASPASVTFDAGALKSSSPFGVKFQGALLGSSGQKTIAAANIGQFEMRTTAGDSFMAWCVDLFHTINLKAITPKKTLSYTETILSTDSSGNTMALSNPLSSQQVHDVLALATYGNQRLADMAPGFERNVISGAVQVAIWDTIYEGELTYTVQGNTTNGFTRADFAGLVEDLQDLAPSLSTGNALALLNLDNFGAIRTQGLVGGLPGSQTTLTGGGVSPVPEPSSLALFGLGLMLTAAAARKRRAA